MIRDFFRKDFFTKQTIGMTFARMAVFVPIAIVLICFVIDFHFDRDLERYKESTKQRWREQAEIRAEAQRRHSETKQRTESVSDTQQLALETPDPEPVEPQPNEGPSTGVVEKVEIMTSGPLKGMTVEAAKAFANQNLADSKAAVRKRHQWELREKEIFQRWSKNEKQIINLAIAYTEKGDGEFGLILSIYKLMPEEQREQVRQELLQTEPADKVNAFFDNVANAATKTPEQLQRDAQDILKSREAYRTAMRELEIKREQLKLELEEHESTRPF